MIQELNTIIDNQTIKGYLYKPEQVQQKLPLLILSHGFFANHKWLTNYAETLVKQYILCYTFDFRGGGPDIESDGTIEESSILTQIKDLNKIIQELSKQEIVNNQQIYLLGHSQGGLVSAITATTNNIKALFLLAPAYNIPDEMKKIENTPTNIPIKHVAGIFTRKYIQEAITIKIYDDIKEYKGKTHIFHGKNDQLVPLKYSQEAIKHYENAKLTIIEDETHNFTPNTQQKIIKEIIKEINGMKK